MHLSSLLLFLSLGALLKCAAGSEWCYHGCEHSPTHWADIPGVSCGEKRQSPINIVTSKVQIDHHLLNFTFVNFSSQHVIKSIKTTGHTVKCILEANEVEVSGGGLNGTYSTIQFHFHWGNTEYHSGSEHMIDGHRYPMEMHIVSLKKGLPVQNAKEDSEGIAVLGFFINATDDGDMSGPWSELTSYLTNVTDTEVEMNNTISIDDLIGNVDLTKFYRYMGSLTTPDCNEAVVWTVFQQPININKKLVQWFPMKTGLTDVYRPTQPLNGRDVFASHATPLPPSHSWCYEEEPCEYKPSHWHMLPHSNCGGKRQSPVNIETHDAVVDEHLDAFTFTKFDDKQAIMHIVNTGHSVCAERGHGGGLRGGLGYVYSTLQFHFHWGSDKSDGSEHKVDSKRYPMEMHIVNKRKDLTLAEALQTPNGLAVLGFLIEAKNAHSRSSENPETHPTSDMEAWKKLTSYIPAIQNISSEVNVTDEISIDDLLGDVNRAEYYRYNGSLTTPSCHEAVVWTVFKESVKMDKSLMMMFPTYAGYHNVYRPTQSLHNRTIYTTTSASSAPVPIMLLLMLACLCAFSHNLHL